VLQEDVELPDGTLVFDGCEDVEIDGTHYRVINTAKLAAGVSRNGTYYVFLTGPARG
jgi:hypothetical protein